jgi:hypothetical protein
MTRNINSSTGRELELIDRDIADITDYLAGEMSDDDRARLEQRLVADAAFFEKVFPVIDGWMLPIDTAEAVDVVVARGVAIEAAAATAAVTAATAAATVAASVDAASVTVSPPLAAPAAVPTIAKPFRRRGPLFWSKVSVGAIAAGIIGLMAYKGPPTLYEPNPLAGFYMTNDSTSRDVMLPDRSRVHLDPNGSVLWDARVSDGRIVVFLHGHATIQVAPDHHISVWTPGGSATLMAGEFALGYDGLENTMTVVATRGQAFLIDHSEHPVRQALNTGDSGSVKTKGQVNGQIDTPPPLTPSDDFQLRAQPGCCSAAAGGALHGDDL